MVESRLAGIILLCLLSGSGWAATPSPTLIVTPPQPKWSELTVPQKIILAPLADDWDSFEYYRQKQWLGITARFPTMSSGEQSRIQKQMQEWGKLTPAQRQKARENFLSTTQLPTEKKRELKQKWEEYSSLPPEEKEKFKQQAKAKPTPGAAKGEAPKQVLPTTEPPSLNPAVLLRDQGTAQAARPSPATPATTTPASESAPAASPSPPDASPKP